MVNHGIQVSCRVRGASDATANADTDCVAVDASACCLVVRPPANSGAATSYSCFDGVYPAYATQQEVFESIGRPFVRDLLAGYNCTILVYGQTGSGKTYTTVGGRSSETRGLVPRAIEAALEEMACIDPEEFDVALTTSFVEVYQEKLRDLLLPTSSRKLELREDKERGVRIAGASEIAVSSMAGGLAVLARGNAQRSTGSTLLNRDSSRSHSVLILKFAKKHVVSGHKLRGQLFFVDLAGSEKAEKSGAIGTRMEEAKHINRSLSALGNVINALTDESARHVPYRDSKLTRLLQASLGGNAKTHLLLTCSTSSEHVGETLSTLRFGCRAKYIQNSPHVNSETSCGIAEYGELLTTLQDKIENLHRYIRQLEGSRCEACASRDPVGSSRTGTQTHDTPEECEEESMNTLQTTEPTDWCSEEDPATETVGGVATEKHRSFSLQEDQDGAVADDLIHAEIQSLRKALANMARDYKKKEHAYHVSRKVMEVAEQQLDARHRSQEQTIQRQAADLRDALTTTSQLEQKIALLDESNRLLRVELRRLKTTQVKLHEGESAEAEILRRQLDAAELQGKRLQTQLAASHQEQEGLTARLAHKEHELVALRGEMELLRLKKAPPGAAATLGLVSPLRVAVPGSPARPATAVDFKTLLRDPTVNGDVSTSVGMLNIQSWWAGGKPVETTATAAANQHESRVWLESSASGRAYPVAALSPTSSSLIRGENSASTNGSTQEEAASRSWLSPVGSRASTSGSDIAGSPARPFRARLVGLLNSLEEETTAYRELAEETKERVMSRGGGSRRPRQQLPGLDTSVLTMGSSKTPHTPP